MRLSAGVFSLLLLAVIFIGGQAKAAVINVITTADTVANDGGCSLREAISAVNTGLASGTVFVQFTRAYIKRPNPSNG